MNRILIISLFAVLGSFGTNGQINGRSLGAQLRGAERSERKAASAFDNGGERGAGVVRTYVENKDLRTADRWTADTVYYKECERRNSWICGVGEALRRCPEGEYLMLTRRNASGHYLRAEYFGKTAPAEFRCVVIGDDRPFDYDTTVMSGLSDWFKREREISRIDFVPSGDGELVVMETVYTEAGERAHTLELERIEAGRAVGFYYLPYGAALTLTSSNKYTSPTGFIFDYAEDGSYKEITPIDATGWPIANKGRK